MTLETIRAEAETEYPIDQRFASEVEEKTERELQMMQRNAYISGRTKSVEGSAGVWRDGTDLPEVFKNVNGRIKYDHSPITMIYIAANNLYAISLCSTLKPEQVEWLDTSTPSNPVVQQLREALEKVQVNLKLGQIENANQIAKQALEQSKHIV